MPQGCQKHRRAYRACSWNPGSCGALGLYCVALTFLTLGWKRLHQPISIGRTQKSALQFPPG